MRSDPFRLILRLLVVAFFAGCAHTIQYRNPTELLLTTDKSTTILFKQLNEKLSEHKYKIAKEDMNAGLLILAPRGFSYDFEGRKIVARQTVQMRQEGGSLKVRIVYDCNYTGDRRLFSRCMLDDQEAISKISRVEKGFVESIRPLLVNHVDIGVAVSAPVAPTPAPVEPVRAPASAPAAKASAPVAPSAPASFDDWGDAAH